MSHLKNIKNNFNKMNQKNLFSFIFNNKVKNPLNLVQTFLQKNSIDFKNIECYDFENEECKILFN